MWQAMCLVCVEQREPSLILAVCNHRPAPTAQWAVGQGTADPPGFLLNHSWGVCTPVPTDILMGQAGGRGPTRTRCIFLEIRSHSKIFEKKAHKHDILYTICWCSVAKSCLTLGNPMDCSTPGFPVLHHLPEFAQTHVHWVKRLWMKLHLYWNQFWDA